MKRRGGKTKENEMERECRPAFWSKSVRIHPDDAIRLGMQSRAIKLSNEHDPAGSFVWLREKTVVALGIATVAECSSASTKTKKKGGGKSQKKNQKRDAKTRQCAWVLKASERNDRNRARTSTAPSKARVTSEVGDRGDALSSSLVS